ncbi:ergothioneine biosynthesis protein EgtB [Mycobacteroides chelonae]|uniref:Hercynine oxygenase n=1 Tax=Mycobacteroides chelonae TaxID=1774 RepID=A0AB73LF27_MYCCH|nr:ergothioneine biosynthesis protein EgtB [Mycobacteroides chelonae]MBV6362700.1 ergothioneine biosynthesis protein EgtB [Mycobacteroides chelonae]MEC4836281.1 ergothioneine biosynthesis protein EgtB [Mycobacteroides chelonae]MEC4838309.1 ergothioneine biosynthesis protein EgtB [Mycobacteroides chelonae]MEC4846029.1 ergothioneine biosynthesis protein EgtB [Mycobacteroides chelonae]MEC4855174.1 ergothioneine biosynthesis protein EgtB [Mycobacteroides chelonae]
MIREELARDLEAARLRTLTITDHDDAELHRQYDPLMSPLVWDLAHIGQQEELWLLRDGDPQKPGMLPGDIESLYDAFRHTRASRVQLPLLSPAQARSFCHEVRGRVLDRLEALPSDGSARSDEFTYAMVLSHEHQHDETMLQALSIRRGAALLERVDPLPPGRPGVAGTSVLVPAGPFVLGVDAIDEPFALDNERPAHVVDLPSFRIGTVPVTNAEWSAFIADGGYRREEFWTEAGWTHRCMEDLTAPKFWNRGGTLTRFGRELQRVPDEPVQHVTFHEAQAYAAWAGARLPTEAEWEKACVWDPEVNVRRRFPWGEDLPSRDRANLGGGALGPAPVGAYPASASPYGAEQMLGDVWEWTTSPLRPWPGFTPMIYQQYSEPFFEGTGAGDYRVLRGGSWAVSPSIMRPSFRNWDHPIRRQIFSGVRLAWDV